MRFFLFQSWEDRSPSSVYEELSVYKTERVSHQRDGYRRSSQAETTSTVVTKLVLIISNWSFVRDNKTNPKKIKCTNQDVTIALKLASSFFRTAPPTDQKRQPYDFDKTGLIMPYSAFLSLLRNKDFTDGYIKKIRDHYARDTGDRTVGTPKHRDEGLKKKAVKPSATTLRRQYAEAFPELADADSPQSDARKKKAAKSSAKTQPTEESDSETAVSEDAVVSDSSDYDNDNDNSVAAGRGKAPVKTQLITGKQAEKAGHDSDVTEDDEEEEEEEVNKDEGVDSDHGGHGGSRRAKKKAGDPPTASSRGKKHPTASSSSAVAKTGRRAVKAARKN